MNMRLRFVWALLCIPACGGSGSGPATIRLVDTFSTAEIENVTAAAPSIQPTEWRFDDATATTPWKAGPGALENELPRNQEAEAEMTSEELQRLRSLGYVK
jgi:hypothetical protein